MVGAEIKTMKRSQGARRREKDGRGAIISRMTKKKINKSLCLKSLIIPGVKKVKRPLNEIFILDLTQSVTPLCSCPKGLCKVRIWRFGILVFRAYIVVIMLKI